MARGKLKRTDSRADLVLMYARSFVKANGYAPTLREICDGCGISSTSVAKYYLDNLEDRGLIERDPGISRGIIIPDRERAREKKWQELAGRFAGYANFMYLHLDRNTSGNVVDRAEEMFNEFQPYLAFDE